MAVHHKFMAMEDTRSNYVSPGVRGPLPVQARDRRVVDE
jgi:hypothetical protein